MKERFIRISEDKIYFTNHHFIDLSKTNFPENSLSFKYHLDIFLRVEISNYNQQSKSLDIEIIDYNPEDTHNFNNQELKKKINKINFKELEWYSLEKLLSSYKNNLPKLIPNAFKKTLTQINKIDESVGEINNLEKFNLVKNDEIGPSLIPVENKTQILDFEFSEYFENSTFHLGYISLNRKLNIESNEIEIKIYNKNIIPEYEYIKSYFSNYFKNEKFKISTRVEISNQEIVNIKNHSNEIEEINNNVIDSVKRQIISNTINFIDEDENDKGTFTINEIFSKIDNRNNIFEQTENDIISQILELRNPRNKKQLIYLASKKHNPIEKIRFTLKPFFGFIFFINGKEKNHICWELLNSHATYIWSFKKTIPVKKIIKQSKNEVNTIKQFGRKKYRIQVKMNELETNFKFIIINHSKSSKKEGFDIWKDKLSINTQ